MSENKICKFFEYNGAKVPSIGLGTAFMTSDIAEVVYSSIKDGTILIDTASKYGSEEGVGKGIKRAIDEGIVKREDLFVTTKLANYEKTDPESAIKQSLKTLGLDYVDLYLEHWPKFYDYGENEKK
jgi:diketogulonate reductase-like aldo/keto reductase